MVAFFSKVVQKVKTFFGFPEYKMIYGLIKTVGLAYYLITIPDQRNCA